MTRFWLAWRLVESRRATLTEIRQHWTAVDLVDANIMLDMVEEAKAAAHRAANTVSCFMV